MENTSRPWVLVAVGVCGLLSLAILLGRRGGPDPHHETQREEQRARAVLEKSSGTSGWAVHDVEPEAPHRGSGRVVGGGDAEPLAGEHGVGRARTGSEHVPGGRTDLEPGPGGQGRSPGARQRMSGFKAEGSGLAADGSGGARGSAADRLARQRREARERATQVQPEVVPAEPAFGHAAVDPEAPVYSAFKDGKLESEEGVAPVVVHNVESKEGTATFAKDSQYTVPQAGGVQGPSGSVSFWMKPDWGGADKDDAHMLDLSTPNVWENRLSINKNGRFLRFMMFPNTGQEVGVSTLVDDWQAGDAHHVVATWGPQDDGGSIIEFYVDGRLVGRDTYDGEFEVPSTNPLIIGNNQGGQLGARGGLSGLEIYNRRIDADKVGTLFQTAPR